MKTRFEGPEGKRRLCEALTQQELIPDAEVAARVAADVELTQHDPGTRIITADADDNDVYFILSGEARVEVAGRTIARRRSGQHVGEMSAIDASARRSASVVATELTVCARLSEPSFVTIADAYPVVWRSVAKGLATRLRERGTFVRPPNATARLFIGSAVEGLDVAHAVQAALDHDRIVVTVWTDGVFGPSGNTCDSLLAEMHRTDFGVFVVRGDDITESRGQAMLSPRDNVIFELGLFMGVLGRERTFVLRPRGLDIKIPTDLLGLTLLDHAAPEDANDLRATLGPAVLALRKAVERLGSR